MELNSEPTCEVLFVVLARNGEKKKHEEAAKWRRKGEGRCSSWRNCKKPCKELSEGPLFLLGRSERRDPETHATYLCGEG